MSEDTEDTLTIRTEQISGYVKLSSLKVGDEFETESSGGTIAWVINNGAAQAVGVIFDGHTTDMSIAPGMLVKVRKLAPVVAVEEETAEQALFDDAAFVATKQDIAAYTPECTEEEEAELAIPFDKPAHVPPMEDSPKLFPHQETAIKQCESRVHRVGQPNLQIVKEEMLSLKDPIIFAEVDYKAMEEKAQSLRELKTQPEVGDVIEVNGGPSTVLAVYTVPGMTVPPTKPPTVRIIQLTEPEPAAKAATNTTDLPVCKFDLTLNDEQIGLLHFSSATDLFCRGLYFSWTKPTFFAVAKKHFPNLKCGQDYEACMRQIALYRATLRKSGKLG